MAAQIGVKNRRQQRRDDGLNLPTLGCGAFDEIKPRALPFSRWNWDSTMRSGNPAIVFWVTVTFAVILFFYEDPQSSPAPSPTPKTQILGRHDKITFDGTIRGGDSQGSSFYQHLHSIPKEMLGDPDYGNFEFTVRTNSKAKTAIRKSDYQEFEEQRAKFLNEIDNGREYAPDSDKADEAPRCRSVSWTGYVFPSCNKVHELTLERVFDNGKSQDYEVNYLNSGQYRDAWRFKRNEVDHLVVKRFMLNNRWGARDLSTMHKEAIILERMSSSPRVINTYGFCGATMLVEAMASDLHTKIILDDGFASQEKLNKLDDVQPLNDFSTSEKLQITLDMAESLADLHGFEGGPIVHGDTHIEQWLIALDGSIRLNDFNNAHLPLWDQTAGDYCTTSSSYGGTYRSPEEFTGDTQDESRDTFAFGSGIYTLLTGLWPFYDEDYRGISHTQMRKDIANGKRAFIDPRYRTRSYIEGKLVEIMEQTWLQDRTKRPSIFEVVDFLVDAKRTAAKKGELQPSGLIKIPMANL